MGKKYTDAVLYLLSNTWITDTINSHNIDPAFATAIVFPELIRYQYISDKIEVAGLYSLYINYGKEYANFSVGRFQMKPSFAQKIESDALKFGFIVNDKNAYFGSDSTSNSRLERVKRLNSPLWQVRYLMAFIKIFDKMYPANSWESTGEKLRFAATAYNCGYWHPKKYIKKKVSENLFYTTLIPSGSKYNYSDISMEYYKFFIRL